MYDAQCFIKNYNVVQGLANFKKLSLNVQFIKYLVILNYNWLSYNGV